MKKTNLTKEEFEKLEAEYDDFFNKHHYGKCFITILYVNIALLLIVFILPEKILTTFPFLRYFINFMSQIFPNIEIYSSVNKMPELCEFYFSYAWMISVVIVVWCIWKLPQVSKEARKYFGTGEFKNQGIFKEKFIPILDTKLNSLKGSFSTIFGVLLFLFAIYFNFSGDIINTFLGKWMFDRFGLFFVAVFQNISIILILMYIPYDLFARINLKKIKQKNLH